MDEQERLELEAKKIREEIKSLLKSKTLGQLEDENAIKEKRNELFRVLTSLELCKISEKETSIKRR